MAATAPPTTSGPAGSTRTSRPAHQTTASHGGGGSGSELGWVPFGPADPGDPPPGPIYQSLENRDCAGMATQATQQQDNQELWVGLAAVCAAAAGDTGQWTVAQAAAQKFAAAPLDEQDAKCLRLPAIALLQRALAWHSSHPGQQVKVSPPQAGRATACGFGITAVSVVDDAGNAIPGPLQGPVAGGTFLAIQGHGLTSTPVVLIGGAPAKLVNDGYSFSSEHSLATVRVEVPPASHAFVAKIRLRNRAGELVAPVTFAYTAAGPTTTSTPAASTPPLSASAPASAGPS